MAGVPGRPLEPLKVVRGAGGLWLEWNAAADRVEDWPVVGFVVEAMDRQAVGKWTAVGRVGKDLMSDGPTTFKLDKQFNDGTFAYRVFADNRAALSDPLESDWITPDLIGNKRSTFWTSSLKCDPYLFPSDCGILYHSLPNQERIQRLWLGEGMARPEGPKRGWGWGSC